MHQLYQSVLRYLRRSDPLYLFLCIGCSLFGVIVLLSIGQSQLGSYDKARTQLLAAGIGIAAALLLSRVDYHILVKKWPYHCIFTWGLVLPTLVLHNFRIGPLIIGYDAGGTSNYSWYRLGQLTFQPSELAKISFLITYAAHLDRVREKLNRPRYLLGLLLHLGLPVLAIHLQGDDGTALVFLTMGCTMLFMAGLSLRYIVAGAAAAVGAFAAAFSLTGGRLLKSYQAARIMAVFYPQSEAYSAYAYQQNKSVISVGSGQIFGRGLFGVTHNFVPNAWNDFVFSYICESLGFVGGAAVLVVLFAIAIKTVRIGLCSRDRVGSYICAGVFAAMFCQIVVNVGMNLQLVPVIGVTLPFLSAGGSSMIMLFLCVGIVLSVHIYDPPTLFETKK